jgi:hypothetical protein
LQPGHDSRGDDERFLRHEAVDFVAQPHLDAAVPQPPYANVDLAVIDALKFNGYLPCGRCCA